MIITKISQQSRDPERANLYVDGKFYAGLHTLVVLQLGLKVGQVLSPQLIAQLTKTESTQSIWDYSLRNLSASPKSRRQLVGKLASKFNKEEAESTVARLEEAGLVDDERLAEMLVTRHVLSANKSRREIEAALTLKGLPREIVKAALATLPSEYDEEAATRLVKIKVAGSEMDESAKLKITQYLGRKGFDYGVIRKALSSLGGDVE